MEIIVRSGQDIYDIALEYYGSLDYVGKVVMDNKAAIPSLNHQLETGLRLEVFPSGLGNEDVKDFFELKKESCYNAREDREYGDNGGCWSTNGVVWTTNGIPWCSGEGEPDLEGVGYWCVEDDFIVQPDVLEGIGYWFVENDFQVQ